MKTLFSFFVLSIFPLISIGIVSAVGYSDCSIYGNCLPSSTGGDTYYINQTNQTIINGSSYNVTYATWAYNQTQSPYFYNQTQSIYFYNMTKSPFFYNMTKSPFFYNMSDGKGTMNYTNIALTNQSNYLTWILKVLNITATNGIFDYIYGDGSHITNLSCSGGSCCNITNLCTGSGKGCNELLTQEDCEFYFCNWTESYSCNGGGCEGSACYGAFCHGEEGCDGIGTQEDCEMNQCSWESCTQEDSFMCESAGCSWEYCELYDEMSCGEHQCNWESCGYETEEDCNNNGCSWEENSGCNGDAMSCETINRENCTQYEGCDLQSTYFDSIWSMDSDKIYETNETKPIRIGTDTPKYDEFVTIVNTLGNGVISYQGKTESILNFIVPIEKDGTDYDIGIMSPNEYEIGFGWMNHQENEAVFAIDEDNNIITAWSWYHDVDNGGAFLLGTKTVDGTGARGIVNGDFSVSENYWVNSTIGATDCYDSTGGGQVCSVGGIITSITDDPSDMKYKTNVINLTEDSCTKLNQLNSISYNLNANFYADTSAKANNDKIFYGYSAQEVQKVFPELVKNVTIYAYKMVNITEPVRQFNTTNRTSGKGYYYYVNKTIPHAIRYSKGSYLSFAPDSLVAIQQYCLKKEATKTNELQTKINKINECLKKNEDFKTYRECALR